MNKYIVTIALTGAITVSGFGIPANESFSRPDVALAASTAIPNPYNNQAAVNAKADAIIQTAKGLIGKANYASPSEVNYSSLRFRCGSFLHYVFRVNGIDLATSDENNMLQQGYAVPRDQLQKGDLVFFDGAPTDNDPASHTGIYIGDNKIIHMADFELDVTISDLDSTTFYRDSYIGARRVLPSLLSANPATKGDKVVETAFGLMGKVKISTTDNDESSSTFTNGGLVNHVLQKNGMDLGTINVKEQINLGRAIPIDQLKKGDLVFFNDTVGSAVPSVVGIYAGDHRLILATNANGVYTRVDLLDWYRTHYIVARRVFNENAVEPAPVPKPKPVPIVTKADQIVNFAAGLMGKAKFGYAYDESSLTFTSGGFTRYVYKQYGIDLGSTLVSDQAKLGQAMAKENLQKGDLVFFSLDNTATSISHVGIYMGDHRVILLSIGGSGVVTQSLDSTWAKNNYVTARRVL